jgi:ketosteroid isomerase-like protein
MPSIDYQAPALAWYDAMAVRDWDRLRGLVGLNIDFVVAQGFPNGGHYVGRDAVFDDYFPEAGKAWDSLVPVIDQVIPAGEYTTILGRYVGVTAATKTAFDIDFAHVWRSDGEQLTELRQYIDTALFQDRVAGIAA